MNEIRPTSSSKQDQPHTPNSLIAKSQPLNFSGFRTPNVHNVALHHLYVKKRYRECRVFVKNILAQYHDALCENLFVLMAKISREEALLHDAVTWLKKALVHNPNSAKLLYELGKCHYLMAEHNKAIETFSLAIEKDKSDWKIYYWQSLAYYHVLRPPFCMQKAQEVLIDCPYLHKSADILMFLARLLGELNDIGPAIDAYKHSIQLEPENVDLIHSLGMLYLKTQNEENAFAMLGKALTYDPHFVPSVLAIASILQSRGDFDVALSKYKVVATDFDHSYALWNNIGLCYYGKSKLVTAILCLNKANYLCPLDWKVLFNLSICYYQLRQFASSYHFISSAFAICPQHPLILVVIALTLTQLGDFRNAREAYKRALKLSPDLMVVRLNFAIFEYRHGDPHDSIRVIGNALNDFTNGYEEINMLVNRLRSCYETMATENIEMKHLLESFKVGQQNVDNVSENEPN